MARIFTSGAEEADLKALWSLVESVGVNSALGVLQAFGSTDLVTFEPRTGRGMYLLDKEVFLRNDFGLVNTYTELFFGFAFRTTSLFAGRVFFYAWTDDPGVYGNHLGLRLLATGAVEVVRSGTQIAVSAAGVVSTNTWHYFEVWFKPLSANGRAVVYVDGVKVIDFTGNTQAEDTYINAYQFQGLEYGYNNIVAFDDIVVNDASGSENNTFPGMVRLLPIRPQDAGNYAQWDRGGVDLGSDEAQARNGTWEYSMLQTSVADELVTFVPEIPDLPAGATITNVVLTARAKVESGAGVIAPMVRANGTDDISADQTLLSSWRYAQYAWAVNPDDSAAWEEADLATLEIGVSS